MDGRYRNSGMLLRLPTTAEVDTWKPQTKPALIAFLLGSPAYGARVAVSVHEDYLRTALGEMERQCGSIDAYLSDVLGVDAGLRETLEARLLD